MTPALWRAAALLAGTALLAAYSARSLGEPRSHGFPRFFAFVAILALVVVNSARWFADPFSARQVVSWALLAVSAALAAHGFHLLRAAGAPSGDRIFAADHRFETTTRLVVRGAYRFIRHPMYASLVALAWGSMLKDPTTLAAALAAAATMFLVATARAEERENLVRFGEAYLGYCARTRMFVPFLW